MTKNIYARRVRNQQIILRDDWPCRMIILEIDLYLDDNNLKTQTICER